MKKNKSEKGTTLIELMIAILVLAIGFGGIAVLLSSTISSDSKNRWDTAATLLAQMVMEQISAQHVYTDPAATTLNVTDCAGNTWTITTTPGAAGTGNGATLKTDGTINFSQAYSAVAAGYKMNYVDCSTQGGLKTVYDVRWNVMNVSTNTTTRFITVAARPAFSNVSQLGGALYAIPATLRGIGGPSAGQ